MTFQPAEGALLADKYRLNSRIGKGGMGQIWTATDIQLDRVVAIKFIDPALMQHERVRQRFEREARTSARLQSRYIVRIYDHGVADEAPFFVMEYLDGEDLADRLMREGRLPLLAAALLLRQAAKGVQHAHDNGVVHRDLKPRNLFIADDDGEETVKILDFGVAKAEWAKGGDTKTGDIVGSPHYMSPEQVHGAQKVDHRADLWSLGVILFRLLTGKRPFRGEGIGEVIIKICTEDPLTATDLVPDLPAGIDEFFARALAREPDQRFQSAEEMSDAFDQVAGVERRRKKPSMRGLRTVIAQTATPAEDEEKTIRTPTSQDVVVAPGPAAPPSVPSTPSGPSTPPAPDGVDAAPASSPTPSSTPNIELQSHSEPSAPPEPDLVAPTAPTVPASSPSTPSLQVDEAEESESIPSIGSLGGPSFGTLASIQASLPPTVPAKRRLRWILGGVVGATGLLLIIVVASSSGGDESSETSPAAAAATAALTEPAAEPTEPEAVSEPPASATATDTAAAEPPPAKSAEPVATPRPRPRPRPRPQPKAEPTENTRDRLGY